MSVDDEDTGRRRCRTDRQTEIGRKGRQHSQTGHVVKRNFVMVTVIFHINK